MRLMFSPIFAFLVCTVGTVVWIAAACAAWFWGSGRHLADGAIAGWLALCPVSAGGAYFILSGRFEPTAWRGLSRTVVAAICAPSIAVWLLVMSYFFAFANQM